VAAIFSCLFANIWQSKVGFIFYFYRKFYKYRNYFALNNVFIISGLLTTT